MKNRTARWEIAAQDLRSLRTFYANLFDWTIDSDQPDKYAVVQTNGHVDGFILRSDPGIPTYVSVYFEVDDVEQHLKRAESLGGTIYLPATPSPIEGEECFGIFGDLEGNLVGLVQRSAD